MSFLKSLGKIFSAPPSKTERALYLYVQCDKCGEKLRARVDMWNEISPEFDGKSEKAVSYHCRKVLVGEKRCYQSIELILEFDKNHRLIEKQIHGGKYIDEAAFNNQES
jgi:hypothetical protein